MGFEVVAVISPRAGKEERVREGLKDMANHVQANEPGSVRYQVYEQVNAQGPADFVVVEEYTDAAAFDHHKGTEFFQGLGKAIQEEDLLTKPLDIKVVKKVGGFWSR